MVELTRQQAERYRRAIVQGAQGLSDEQAVMVPLLFEPWQPGMELTAGQRVCDEGILYSVLIGHITQESWRPKNTPSLFAQVLIPDPEIIPEWVQPESTNPYMQGDKVRHNGKVWISDIDYNVYEPGVAGWSETGGQE